MKRRRRQLVPAEKTLVVNVYDYFVKEAEAGRNNERDSRQRTADATLFGVSTVQRVLAARNVDPGSNFIQVWAPFLLLGLSSMLSSHRHF